MVGALESQFLKMIVSLTGAKKVLDVGTFTGMSALAFAEGMQQSYSKERWEELEVVTIEFDENVAKTAQEIFDCSSEQNQALGQMIKLLVGDAKKIMKDMASKGEQFDLIFLDADKESYGQYYDLAMGPMSSDPSTKALLASGGVLLADNSLCSLLYDQTDERSQALHDFNRKVKQDHRTEQVVLTIREGVTMIRRKGEVRA